MRLDASDGSRVACTHDDTDPLGKFAKSSALKYAFLAALAALVIIIFIPGAQSAHALPTVPATQQEVAQLLVNAYDAGKLIMVPNSIYTKEILPVAQTGSALPGCAVDPRILQILVLAIDRFGSAGVSDIQRPCIGVSLNCPTSSHCQSPGGAIDFYSVGGVVLNGGNARTRDLLQYLDPIVPSGTQAGQVNCRVASPLSLDNFTQFSDSCDHQHIDFRNTNAPLNVDSSSSSPALPGGTLMQVAVSGGTWTRLNTGVVLGSGRISTVNMGGAFPEVFENESGVLMQVAVLGSTWTKLNTGVVIGAGQISAVNMKGSVQVFVNESGVLMQVGVVGGVWTKLNTGVVISSGQDLRGQYGRLYCAGVRQ